MIFIVQTVDSLITSADCESVRFILTREIIMFFHLASYNSLFRELSFIKISYAEATHFLFSRYTPWVPI